MSPISTDKQLVFLYPWTSWRSIARNVGYAMLLACAMPVLLSLFTGFMAIAFALLTAIGFSILLAAPFFAAAGFRMKRKTEISHE